MMNMSRKDKKLIAIGLTVAIIFVIVGTLVFSYSMETLDVQAEELGSQASNIWNAPFPEYIIVGHENEAYTILLGIISTTAIFAVSLGVAMLLKKPKGHPQA
jgi:hypothetical protein